MINKNFKIILFNGGFAGDLITALYNPETFKRFNQKSVVLADTVTRLKDYEFMENNSIKQKISYIESIRHVGVCSSHDLELSLRLRENTHLVYCSDNEMANFFFKRIPRNKKDSIMTFDEHLAWQESSKKVFRYQVDLAQMTQHNFLEQINVSNSKSAAILKGWIGLNL